MVGDYAFGGEFLRHLKEVMKEEVSGEDVIVTVKLPRWVVDKIDETIKARRLWRNRSEFIRAAIKDLLERWDPSR